MAYGDTSNYYGRVVRKLKKARTDYAQTRGKSKAGKINLSSEHAMGRAHLRSATSNTIGNTPAFRAGANMGYMGKRKGFGSNSMKNLFARPY